MISERAFETLTAFADGILRTEWGPARDRTELIKARAELERAQCRARETTIEAAEPDPMDVQRVIDEALVEDAIRRHARIMLANMTTDHAPKPGDLFPSHHYTQSQWHMALIIALSAVPVDEAAAHLREEALQALDTNPKEGP